MYAYVYACIRILCMYICIYVYVSHRRRAAKKSPPTRSSSVYYLHKVKYVAGTWVPQAKKKSSRKKAATNSSPVTAESQPAAGDEDASALSSDWSSTVTSSSQPLLQGLPNNGINAACDYCAGCSEAFAYEECVEEEMSSIAALSGTALEIASEIPAPLQVRAGWRMTRTHTHTGESTGGGRERETVREREFAHPE